MQKEEGKKQKEKGRNQSNLCRCQGFRLAAKAYYYLNLKEEIKAGKTPISSILHHGIFPFSFLVPPSAFSFLVFLPPFSFLLLRFSFFLLYWLLFAVRIEATKIAVNSLHSFVRLASRSSETIPESTSSSSQ